MLEILENKLVFGDEFEVNNQLNHTETQQTLTI